MKTIVRTYFFFLQAFEIKSLPILHLFSLLPSILNPLRWQHITVPFPTTTIHCIRWINFTMEYNNFGTFRLHRRFKVSHRNFLQTMIFIALAPAFWPIGLFTFTVYVPRQIGLLITEFFPDFNKVFTEIRQKPRESTQFKTIYRTITGNSPRTFPVMNNQKLTWIGKELIDIIDNHHVKIEEECIAFQTIKIRFKSRQLVPATLRRTFRQCQRWNRETLYCRINAFSTIRQTDHFKVDCRMSFNHIV